MGDDIDDMLENVGKPKAPKTPKTLPSPATDPPAPKTAMKTAMKAPRTPTPKAAMKAPPASKDSMKSFSVSTPPPFGTKCPVHFNGCKVYRDASAYRVMPAPRESKYDRKFVFGDSEKNAWKAVMAYCKKPFIPKESVNYVPIKLPRDL